MIQPPELLLVFPPFWDGGVPYLSVPTLAAYLKQQGCAVETVDLNKICMRQLLTPESLRAAMDNARRVLAGWSPLNGDADAKTLFQENLRYCKRVWTEAGTSLFPDSERGGNGAAPPAGIDEYAAANRRLRWIFRIIGAPYGPLPSGGGGPVCIQEYDRLSQVTAAVRRAEIPGVDLIRSFAERHAFRGIPVLGISVAAPSQLLPALFLARTFKALSGDTFVCIGGPHIPYIVDALPSCMKPFDWVDAFVTGEGELPLWQICRAAAHNGDVTGVKGLHLRRDGRIVFTGAQDVVDMDDLPPPDFTHFEPETYPTNDGTVCLTFARGCSWSRCAFCTQFITFSGYRTMSDRQVAHHIETVTRRHAIRSISLNDENVTPERLRAFGAIIRRTAPDVKWMTLARLSPKLADRALVQELADSGCVMLSLGLESANQKVLNFNRKGISVESMPAILQTLHQAGIWVHLFVILGLPGETSDSALQTIGFIHDHLDMIDSVSPTVFRLERHSAIWRHPEEFGVIPEPVPDDWCAVEIPCETEKWMRRGESLIFIEYLIHSLVGRRQCPIEQGDLNGQYLIQLLERHGTTRLRTEMEKRAGRSAAARSALIADDELFRKWMSTPVFGKLAAHEGDRDVLLSVPAQGIFLFLNRAGQRILKLRSLGLSLKDIRKAYRHLVSEVVEDDVEMEWKLDTFTLLILTSRIIQDSLFQAEHLGVNPAAHADRPCDTPAAYPGIAQK